MVRKRNSSSFKLFTRLHVLLQVMPIKLSGAKVLATEISSPCFFGGFHLAWRWR